MIGASVAFESVLKVKVRAIKSWERWQSSWFVVCGRSGEAWKSWEFEDRVAECIVG